MAFFNGSLSDEQISGTHTSSEGESDSYNININDGFGSNSKCLHLGQMMVVRLISIEWDKQ